MFLLALDVGNTSITIGIFRGRRLAAQGRISTHTVRPSTGSGRTGRQIASNLRVLFRKKGIALQDVQAVIVSSVVPKATVALKKALRSLKLPKPLVLGENVKAPIINRYRIPSQVGQDRLCNAVAACELYGGPAIVADFGTALTIDLVSARREYLGGVIVPGMEMALEALHSRTALLPKIRLAPPKELLGRDTASSMRSGIFYGYGALCDGIVGLFKKKHVRGAKVIATGGCAGLVAPFSRTIQKVNPNLTLQGLGLIYRGIKKDLDNQREICKILFR